MISNVKNTKALPVLTNPICVDLIAKNISASDGVNLLLTHSDLAFSDSLPTTVARSLSPQERCKFFSQFRGEASFASKVINSIMKRQEATERMEGIAWLVSCAKPEERQSLMDDAFNLLKNADPLQMHKMLDHLTGSMIPIIKNILITDTDSIEITFFNHLRNYFDRIETLGSVHVIEYWVQFIVSMSEDLTDQKIKSFQDLTRFLSSKNITAQVREEIVKFYSYVIADKVVTTEYETLKEEILEEISKILKENAVTKETKKNTLCNLVSVVAADPNEEWSESFHQKLENMVEKLALEVEETLSPIEREEVLRHFVYAFYNQVLDPIWGLRQIDFFSRNKIASEEMRNTIKELKEFIREKQLLNINF